MISVLIPVYNEEQLLEESVLKVHQYLEERNHEHEIIVVSNGSSDGTVSIGTQLAQRFSYFRFFELPQKGVGRAFVQAVQAARGEYLISLDIDLSSRLDFIMHAIDLLPSAELVVGSKAMGTQQRSYFRRTASRFYTFFVRLLFQLEVSDFSIGTKAYRRDLLLPTLPHLDAGTGFFLELCIYMKKRGCPIAEIAVDCQDFRESHFHLIREGAYRFTHLAKCWFALRRQSSWICADWGTTKNVPESAASSKCTSRFH
jgi:glycosyltransferase involved in cell wall biosynthesis